ncbi:homoprotocatechuate degradation operon regulator HpaR [Alisedimentitalea sp. MJ-SS2]|uniref:homoprotocatechuate degradation operon regulator HpaR n=1 Tax=Aliisedimentitalea sp. MJ-SS2 TaxID=3049795 RepID=UPI00290B2770|nr:homoprotocatechuate degradation operon regulator HpaR [Alisedimentitalea sp. MJ-SS2]MDU8927496.1 homoprotocatechuate degradation operon regulator HpaR [Alisedimentitalea sp. MJ-SS2]
MTDRPSLPSTSRSLPIAMLRARETMMAPIRHMLNKAGVTEQQWRVLRVLDEHGTMDPKDLAQGASLLNPSLTRIMQLLDKKGLIARKDHPTDRRKVLVDITEEGRVLLREAAPESAAIFARLEERYGREKMEQLLDLLNELSSVDLD